MGLPTEAPTVEALASGGLELQGLATMLRLIAEAESIEALIRRLPTLADTRLHVDYAEAARRLGIPENWLRDRIGSLPHRKMGRYVIFSEADLKAISEMYAAHPNGAEKSKGSDGSNPSVLTPSSRSRSRARR
ncbi:MULTISPECIES: helix-turn-helix domain-containing protein [Streptomyces]|uniref:helix-turn-helix domain-containing protein n=1 Tax=Streptomyces TaxID=1883 RepID=UPI00117D719D|nr:helix-turn-helix domain-containing protein [Streptomyces kasugaensis]